MELEYSCRCFTSYTGIKLPLKLVDELDDESVDRRITYFKGYYDENNRLRVVEKVVYGEIEFSHRSATAPCVALPPPSMASSSQCVLLPFCGDRSVTAPFFAPF